MLHKRKNQYNMKENKNITSKGGLPLTLQGEIIEVGMQAPDFEAYDNNFKQVRLSDFNGKKRVISIFPSIDTPVCASQTRTFNKNAASLGDDTVVISISKDLPFALGRFCAAEGIDRNYTLSDFRGDFGPKYGFLIKEMGLLSRGVIVVDKNGKVAYVEYLDDITKEPDYDKAIAALKSL